MFRKPHPHPHRYSIVFDKCDTFAGAQNASEQDRDVPLARLEGVVHSKASDLLHSFRTRHRWGHYLWRKDNARLHDDGSGHPSVVAHRISEYKGAAETMLEANRNLAQARQQLRQLLALNETTLENEKRHIAREVHDELGQVLTALRMEMSLLNMQFGALDPALPGKVDTMKVLVDCAIQGVRNVATRLRPTALDMGLAAALESLCTEFAARSAIACVFSARDQIDIDEARAVEVYRIVQESLTNISRYAQASQVQVTLGYRGKALGMEVRDNGKGFTAVEETQSKTFGLLGMRERALALGGHLEIVSVPGQGTVVGLTIPIQQDTL
jgi:signal transduction histidine kinase